MMMMVMMMMMINDAYDFDNDGDDDDDADDDDDDDNDDDDDWHWFPVTYWLCEAPVLSFHVSRASIVVAGGSRVGGALGMAGGREEGPSASHARGGAAEQAGDSGAEAAMVGLV